VVLETQHEDHTLEKEILTIKLKLSRELLL
jgi:hypothetical protein